MARQPALGGPGFPEGAVLDALGGPDDLDARFKLKEDEENALREKANTAVLAAYRHQGDVSPEDANRIGRAFLLGIGCEKDMSEAFYWISKAANQKNADAQNNLGDMYVRGLGVSRDDAKAVFWFRKAAIQKNANAQTTLGLMYAQGRGVAQEDAEAAFWLHKAAIQDDIVAQYCLGILYAEGRGVARNDEKAVFWLHNAALERYAFAQYLLGIMFAEGRGVAQDDVEAAFWFHRAANQGHASASDSLDIMFAEGRGVAQEDAEAACWYRNATYRWVDIDQYELDLIYKDGRGVAQNDEKDREYFELDAAQGVEDEELEPNKLAETQENDVKEKAGNTGVVTKERSEPVSDEKKKYTVDLNEVFDRAHEILANAVMGTPAAGAGYQKKIRSNVGFDPEIVDWLKTKETSGKHFSYVNSILKALKEAETNTPNIQSPFRQ